MVNQQLTLLTLTLLLPTHVLLHQLKSEMDSVEGRKSCSKSKFLLNTIPVSLSILHVKNSFYEYKNSSAFLINATSRHYLGTYSFDFKDEKIIALLGY